MSVLQDLNYEVIPGVEIHAEYNHNFSKVLTADCLAFLKALHLKFNSKRLELLQSRIRVQQNINNGILPDFNPETEFIRNSDWQVAPLPHDLIDRRVEITGPVDRKMVINALNSGAKVFMADFEDSNTPSFKACLVGQLNLSDAINRTIYYVNPQNGKEYTLNENTAVLMVRPRGWHLEEKHVLIYGEPMSASLFDFGVYFFNNAQRLIQKGSGPYFYLPKLEHYLEARVWNSVFVFAQDYLSIPQKTIKATVLVETILASFYLDEILYELKDHSAGLNCGRWDYIFSFIKKFKELPGFILPDRAQVTMTVPFMKAYSELVIKVCHKRGVHAMGGMAAQIPIKNNEKANLQALEKVQADKFREVQSGHDGTWVAHPGLVKVALDIFNEYMPTPNQIHNKRNDLTITASDLLAVPKGTITLEGVKTNINVGILYLESWLRGNGAAALYNLMEDAATAEICRTQLWQWLREGVVLNDTQQPFTTELYYELVEGEIQAIKHLVGPKSFETGAFHQAIALFNNLVTNPNFEEFLTIPAYQLID